jgi:UDP-glucose:(glucosyl)LPS alpha-1,2-glucosyltransferase
MDIIGGELKANELNANSNGGTEIIARRMHRDLPQELLQKFHIIHSRVRELDESKVRILVCHDLVDDDETAHLGNNGWLKFHRIVFVSYWQRDSYIKKYGIPYSRTTVIHNGVLAFDGDLTKPDDKINIIYHTTPHRGLELLVPVVEKLQEKWGEQIHLDVFSSFKMYGWEDPPQFGPLFDKVKNTKGMTYHGYQPQEVLYEYLRKAHIFGYPSIWQETSCMALMEAMSAKVCCVHPDYAALPETGAKWTMMYNYHENPHKHCGVFYNVLDVAIELIQEKDRNMQVKIAGQKVYADMYYNWEFQKRQWESLLIMHQDDPVEMEKPVEVFNYTVG